MDASASGSITPQESIVLSPTIAPAIVTSTVVKVELGGGSISTAEQFALDSTGGNTTLINIPKVPESKRQRVASVTRQRPVRSRSPPPHAPMALSVALPAQHDAVMSDGYQTPGTPSGACGAPLAREDMGAIMAQFQAMLLANNHTLENNNILPAIQTAVAPVQAQVSDLAQTLEHLEKTVVGHARRLSRIHI